MPDDQEITGALSEEEMSAIEDALGGRGGESGVHREATTLEAHYDDVMDELAGHADSRNVGLDSVAAVYDAVSDSDDPHLTSHEELMSSTGFDYHRTRQSAAVLSDMGDLHECYDDDWDLWWVRCDQFIADRCSERRISLYRYYAMHDLLYEFQKKVIAWYVRRNRRQQQPYQLRELKEEYVHKIQEEYFPDKPVGDEWSRHIGARYLRTAQDSIVRSYNLTY